MVLTLARTIRIPVLILLVLVALLVVQDRASAVQRTSTAGGDWTNADTWGGTVPAAGDTVIIASGHTVTVSTTVSIVGITVDAGGTLVVTGSLSVGASGLAVEGTVTNNGTLSVTGTLTGAGTLTQGTSATLNIGNALAPTITTLDATTNLPNTVNYNFAGDQAIKVNTYSNLTLSGSGTKTGTPTSVSGALTLAGTAAYDAPTGLSVGGALNLQGGTLTIPNTITVTGNTTLSSGSLTITNIAGTKTFTGDITVNGGTWDNDDVVEPVAVSGNITFISGTFTSGTGLYTLNGANKTITGPITIDALTLVAPGSLSIEGAVTIGTLTATATTVTNNGTLTVTTSLAGTGTLVNGANRTIHIQATVAPAAGLTFDMTSNTPNTVNYSRNDGAS